MTAVNKLPEQQKFLEAVNGIDNLLSDNGFAPKEYYIKIQRFHAEKGNRKKFDEMTYWHDNVPVLDHNNIYRNYYMNEKGVSLHFSVKIAERTGERNELHYGSSDGRRTKIFTNPIARMRRLLKKANEAIIASEEAYFDTPAGIRDQLSNKIDEVWNKIDHHLSRNLSYSQIQRSSGSTSSSVVYDKRSLNDGSVASLRRVEPWVRAGERPVIPKLIIHCEYKPHQEECEEFLTVLEPYIARQLKVIEDWEREQIIGHLTGELVHED